MEIEFVACSRCGTADTIEHMKSRETVPGWHRLCGFCWAEMESARRAGSMVQAWESGCEGEPWEPADFPRVWHPAATVWEPEGPDDSLLSLMAEIKGRVCPDARLVIGPRLRGSHRSAGSTRRTESGRPTIKIALAAGSHPIIALRHELLHAVWPRLPAEARATLKAWGDELRATVPPPTGEEVWWGLPEEAEATAYADFYHECGISSRFPEPPSDVRRTFALIESGRAGR